MVWHRCVGVCGLSQLSLVHPDPFWLLGGWLVVALVELAAPVVAVLFLMVGLGVVSLPAVTLVSVSWLVGLVVGSLSVGLGLGELDWVGHGLLLICGVLVQLWSCCLNLLIVGEGLGCWITYFLVFIERCSCVPAKTSLN